MAAYPAPPNVGDVRANATLARVYGAPAATPQQAAGRASKRKRAAAGLHEMDPALVNTQELGEQLQHELLSALAMPVGAGAAPLPPHAQQMALLAALLQQVALLAPLPAQVANLDARVRNGTIARSDVIQPLQVAGAIPVGFPQTVDQLDALSSAQLQALLLAYGQPVLPVVTRRRRLKQFLGMR